MENEIIYIDKAGLEEIIEYHIAEFEITDGYYHDQGRNITINHAIEYLYNLRVKWEQIKKSCTDGYEIVDEFNVW